MQPRRRDSGASVTRSAATALAAPKPGPSATVGVLTPARATRPDSVGPDSVGPDSVERVAAVSVVVGVSTLVRSLPAVRVAVLRSVVGVSAAVAEAVGVAAVVAAVEAVVVSVGVAVAVSVGVAVESLPAELPLPPPVSSSDASSGGGPSVSSVSARESQSRMWT
jgi:hypothetical protein